MNKNYKYLMIAGLLCNMGDNLIGPFYSVYIHNAGIELAAIGYASVVFNLSLGIFTMVTGKMSDTMNKKVVTVFGYGLYAVGSLLYLVVSQPWHLFVLQLISAVGTACLAAPLSSLYAEFIQKGKEGEQWGFLQGGSRIMVAVAVLLGTLIVKYFGFTTLFLVMFTIQVCATFIQAFLFRPVKN